MSALEYYCQIDYTRNQPHTIVLIRLHEDFYNDMKMHCDNNIVAEGGATKSRQGVGQREKRAFTSAQLTKPVTFFAEEAR